jgi:AmmeMemoRadiSam system protein A
MDVQLSIEERKLLLELARQAIHSAVHGETLPTIDMAALPPSLCEPGASFVTLTRLGQLRGCIGALEAVLPLVEDVRQHAIAAALQDFRFPPVQPEELPTLCIEISRLSEPKDVDYESAQDLVEKLRPGIDGVTLKDGVRRATFLPQVWEKLPDPEVFLSHLCQKMGAPPDLWRSGELQVQVYQVEEFHE